MKVVLTPARGRMAALKMMPAYTLGEGLACAHSAQLGLQRVGCVEESVGEAEGSGDIEEDADADPRLTRLELPERGTGDARTLSDLLGSEVLQLASPRSPDRILINSRERPSMSP